MRPLALKRTAVAVLMLVPLYGATLPAHAAGGLSVTGFSPSSGPVGAVVTITGTGFVSGDIVTFNGTQAAAPKVRSSGRWMTVAVPALATSGLIQVQDPASGQTAASGSAFQVTSGIALASSHLWHGEAMILAGSALTPNTSDQVTLDALVIGSARIDSNGDFQQTFMVPWTTMPGHHTISVTDRIAVFTQPMIIFSSWPTEAQGPQRTSDNAGEFFLPSSKLAGVSEKFNIEYLTPSGAERGGAQPTVENGFVYVSHQDYVSAVNAVTGVPAWDFQAVDTVNTPVTVANGIAYFASTGGDTYAVGASDGHFIWRTTLGDDYSTPLVFNNVLYFGTDSGYVYALGAADGHFIWDFKTGAAVNAAPSIAKGIVYIASSDTYVYALKASTGKELWSAETCNTSGCGADNRPIAVSNGVALVLSEAGFLFALNASTGAYMWSASAGSTFITGGVAVNSGVAYLANQNFLEALRLSDGGELWNYPCNGPLQPTIADNVLYIQCDPSFYGFDLVNGGTPWTWNPGVDNGQQEYFIFGTAVSGGRIYAMTDANSTGNNTDLRLHVLGT